MFLYHLIEELAVARCHPRAHQGSLVPCSDVVGGACQAPINKSAKLLVPALGRGFQKDPVPAGAQGRSSSGSEVMVSRAGRVLVVPRGEERTNSIIPALGGHNAMEDRRICPLAQQGCVSTERETQH